MDPRVQEQLDEQEVKITEILTLVRKTEKYMRWTFWVTLAVIVFPVILLMFVIPAFISSYTSTLDGLL